MNIAATDAGWYSPAIHNSADMFSPIHDMVISDMHCGLVPNTVKFFFPLEHPAYPEYVGREKKFKRIGLKAETS